MVSASCTVQESESFRAEKARLQGKICVTNRLHHADETLWLPWHRCVMRGSFSVLWVSLGLCQWLCRITLISRLACRRMQHSQASSEAGDLIPQLNQRGSASWVYDDVFTSWFLQLRVKACALSKTMLCSNSTLSVSVWPEDSTWCAAQGRWLEKEGARRSDNL